MPLHSPDDLTPEQLTAAILGGGLRRLATRQLVDYLCADCGHRVRDVPATATAPVHCGWQMVSLPATVHTAPVTSRRRRGDATPR